ncbi:hypothetical protein PG984_007965 [Apiospora sp. TS-2023a]
METLEGWFYWDVPARTVMPDGSWFYVGAPILLVVDHDSVDYDSEAPNPYLRNNEWNYYAECDLIIFALFFGEVVVIPPKEDEEEEKDGSGGGDGNNNMGTGSNTGSNTGRNIIKQELDEVTNWDRVWEKMQDAHWVFGIEKLAAYWKKNIIPRLRKIRADHARRFGTSNINGNVPYNALAGLAATCHMRNVDPADHPHGYGKPLPTPADLYMERVCKKFGGKSYEVLREQEQALKEGRQLKKLKRSEDDEGREDDDMAWFRAMTGEEPPQDVCEPQE